MIAPQVDQMGSEAIIREENDKRSNLAFSPLPLLYILLMMMSLENHVE
jgi:hypothetical protein